MSKKTHPFIGNDDENNKNNNNTPGGSTTPSGSSKNPTSGNQGTTSGSANANNNANNSNSNSGGSGNGNNNGVNVSALSRIAQANSESAEDFLVNYNELAQAGKFTPAQFRDEQIQAVLTVLSTVKHPNALLIGDAGVGKTQIVEELALQLQDKNSLVSNVLGDDTVIYELPISLVTGGASMAGQLEKRINAIIDFASDEDNHAILFIDEIHQLFSNKSNQYETLSQALKPALARGDMHVIAATTTGESRELQQDPAFNRRFTSVKVPELTNEQTLEILKSQLPMFNQKHQTASDEAILPDVLNIANEYMTDSHRPDTALTLLDQASAMLNINQTKLGINNAKLTPNNVKEAVMQLLNTKAPKLDAKHLSNTLHAKIFGQDFAVDEVIDSLKRYTLGLNLNKKPASFLFAGPTGTGKSEIAKQISESLFSEPDSIINLNMTEYTHESSLNRLLGSDTGYVGSDSHEARPLDALADNKFQVVLLDEFEKAHPMVQRVFMQALDEGFITDHHNQVIDFSHAIIIATTNAGAVDLQKPTIGFANHNQSATDLHDNIAITDALKKSYPPELLNRFAHVISFNAIDKATYKDILKLNYNTLAPEIAKQVHIQITPEVLDFNDDYDFIDDLADRTYNQTYNARPAKRSIQSLLEDCLIASQNQASIDVINQYLNH